LNKSEFISFIENPLLLDKSHLSALRNITNDFPYFQAGHFLLTKALYNEDHYEFEKQLKATALLVSDREILYRFLNDIQIDGMRQSVKKMEETKVVSETFAVQDLITEIKGEAIIETVKEENIEPEKINDPEALDLGSSEIHIQEIYNSEKHSFTEWLSLSAKNKIDRKTEMVSGEMELSADKKENTATPKSNIPEFEKILDKFIQENPSISRPKADFYNPASMAKYSVEENDELVTETLANIYYSQGAYKKAIRAYEKLCLIYPHKMSYFATLIKKIKEENKND